MNCMTEIEENICLLFCYQSLCSKFANEGGRCRNKGLLEMTTNSNLTTKYVSKALDIILCTQCVFHYTSSINNN